MELKEGMMLRTEYGIAKIIQNDFKDEDMDTVLVVNKELEPGYIGSCDEHLCSVKEILKASYNIIDLIKSKDIILGKDGKLYQCWKVYKDYVFTYSKNKQGQTITLVDYQIDRIMCYEQFESMSYKVGEK